MCDIDIIHNNTYYINELQRGNMFMQTFIATFIAGWLLCSIVTVAAAVADEIHSKKATRMAGGEFWFAMIFVAMAGPIGVGALLAHSLRTTQKLTNK